MSDIRKRAEAAVARYQKNSNNILDRVRLLEIGTSHLPNDSHSNQAPMECFLRTILNEMVCRALLILHSSKLDNYRLNVFLVLLLLS